MTPQVKMTTWVTRESDRARRKKLKEGNRVMKEGKKRANWKNEERMNDKRDEERDGEGERGRDDAQIRENKGKKRVRKER